MNAKNNMTGPAARTRVQTSPKAAAAKTAPEQAPGAGRPLAPRALLLGLLTLLVLIVAARLPFISRPLVGEEGQFAFLAVNNGHDRINPNWVSESPSTDAPDPTHDFLFLARIRGKIHWGPAEHPVPSYLVISKMMRSLSDGTKFDSMSLEQKSRAARLRFFGCFCIALTLLAAIAWDALRGADPWTALLAGGVIAYGLTTPLMVGGSVQPQMDGSIGVMWVAMAAFCLHFALRRAGSALAIVLAAAAGFCSCMGKNEWALAMLGAALAGMACYLVAGRVAPDRDAPPRRAGLTIFLGIVGGVLLGSLTSYVIDPWNYLRGLDVMFRTQKLTLAIWAQTFKSRLPWIWPDFVLLWTAVAAAALGWRRLVARQMSHVVILLWSLALFAGFIISSWPGDNFPRYFCTSIFGFVCFLTVILPRLRLSAALRRGALVLLLLGLACNAFELAANCKNNLSLGSIPSRELGAHVARMLRLKDKLVNYSLPCQTDLNFAYYFPSLDIISNTVSPDEASKMVQE